MPIGLVTDLAGADVEYHISADTTDLDLLVALGSPTEAIRYILHLPSAYVIGGTTLSAAVNGGINSGPELHADSVGTWYIDGDILGKGGDGGDGGATESDFEGAGGGGGAGWVVGVGGTAYGTSTPAQDGTNGTKTTGGTAGTNQAVNPAGNFDFTDGGAGGEAIWVSHQVTIHLSGTIGGGSPGGRGGVKQGGVPFAALDGNDMSELTGNKGFATRTFGTGSITIIGGTVYGTQV